MNYKIIERDDLKFVYKVYENSEVYNLSKGIKVKASKDKRRPNEPPIIYFKKKDGKRIFIYLDQLVASCFCEDYIIGNYIHHIDSNKSNCELSNLMVGSGLKLLREVHNETKEWKLVSIPETGLYYEYYICEDGRLFNGTTGSFVIPFEDKRPGNYSNLRYNLYYGKTTKDTIHYSASRLVAIHFIPIHPEDKDLVLFKDRDHSNLSYNNLYWGDSWDSINQEIPQSERDEVRIKTSLKNTVLGKEKWEELKIPGIEFDYVYSISNFGRVYNEDKHFYCASIDSGYGNLNTQKYKYSMLKVKNVGYKLFSIHRLVAFMFCKNDNPSVKTFVNHINGNPECNMAINLEWCSPLENIKHAINTNLIKSERYDDYVNSYNWRMNTLMAWIYSFKDITNEKAYEFYDQYMNNYYYNSPIHLSYDEFIKIFYEKLESDKDFNTLLKFYRSEYGYA